MYNRNIKKEANEQEERIANELNMRQHKNSGAMAEKFDMSDANFVVETKNTNSQRWMFFSPYWQKLKQYANARLKEPAIVVEVFGARVVVIDYEYFKELIKHEI